MNILDLKELKISTAEFLKFKNLIFEKFGINLTDAKKGLVVNRLQKTMKDLNIRTFNDFYDYILREPTGTALNNLINKISTNYTFFYREQAHFEFLNKKVLPDVVAKETKLNSNDIRLWCAGCSSGEEPYTIIMQMNEFFGSNYNRWSAGILATDISETVLNIAKNAIYEDDKLSNLPKHYISKYFINNKNGTYKIRDFVKEEVTFRRFNLMNDLFPFKKKFHAIFCRNVMIYFDNETKINLVKKFASVLETGGYLFIGHSETLGREITELQYIMPAVYQKIRG